MSALKEFMKGNAVLRRAVKTLKIYREYMCDAADFSSFYLENAEKSGRHEYRIMLLVHSLEKGMCMPKLRPFGQKKAEALMQILKSQSLGQKAEFEYELGISALRAWVAFFDEHGWKNDKVCERIRAFVGGGDAEGAAGYKVLSRPVEPSQGDELAQALLTRRSVRDFEMRELSQSDLEFALRCFCEAPTACNRQMCKVYMVKNQKIKELLHKTVLGVSGFNHDAMTYFIITYDISAFDFFGERSQGHMNAGLVAMNFVNGLHLRGIGSCFMQWANKRSEDKAVRKALRLPKSERIAIVIGAGYYKEASVIPKSCRKPINEIFKVVD